MAGVIALGDQSLAVSSNVLVSLIEFAIAVGTELAQTNEEGAWVHALTEFRNRMWPGMDLDVDALFPNLAQKKFWARVFHEVARDVFLRKLGNHTVTFWQTGTIANSFVIARFLVAAVRKLEPSWTPATGDAHEADEFWVRGIKS